MIFSLKKIHQYLLMIKDLHYPINNLLSEKQYYSKNLFRFLKKKLFKIEYFYLN